MICTRVPGANEMCPTVVYKDRPLLPGKEFLPDEFIVKVILTAPTSAADSPLKHADFPPLASMPTDAVLKGYFAKYAGESYVTKMADFNLLAFLLTKSLVPEKALGELCDAIRTKTPLSRDTQSQLDSTFLAKGLM